LHFRPYGGGKSVSNREISMFVNVNAHPGSRPKALGELGELSRARIVPSEFRYEKGTEVYGEAEPADYIY
jgi:CRP/FNR family transcriptional regulator, nitrogen fixation regulation protein